ncbi:alpha/beta fold hydrolase [Chitinophagaceae bacterium MMS25-I14]
MNKKTRIFLLIVAFTALVLNVFAEENKYPFDVKVSGKGKQSIIFIPGFGCSGDVWNDTRTQYEKDYTCYTLTMAGFAGVPPQNDPTFVKWEKGVADYIMANNIKKPVIVGHSMGGAMALALAADYPTLPGKIIVVDALPCLAAVRDSSFKSKENNDCSTIVSQMKAVNDDQFRMMQRMSMPRMLADTTKLDRVINWTVQSDRTTFGQMYCDFSNTDLRAKIATVTCPALILLEPSFAGISQVINGQYKNLKTAHMEYATKGLHFIMYDDKDWYDKQLAAFLKN